MCRLLFGAPLAGTRGLGVFWSFGVNVVCRLGMLLVQRKYLDFFCWWSLWRELVIGLGTEVGGCE